MSLDLNKCYYLAKNMEQLEQDGKILYINYETTDWLRTDAAGEWIIEQCDGTRRLIDIFKEKAENDGFDTNAVISMLSPFIETCISKKILVDEKNDGLETEELYTKINFEYPGDIWIHVSDKCNLQCPFCYSNSTSKENFSIDVDKVLKFLEGVPEEKRVGIIISGGEPFLFEELPRLVQGIKELKYSHIVVITNGTTGEEMYADVIPYINTLQISLDGTTADIHDVTRGKGSFEKVCRKLELAREYNIKKIVCSFTPTKYNVEDMPNLALFAYRNHIDALHITRLMPTGRGQKNKDMLYPDVELYNKSIREFVTNLKDINSKIYFHRSSEEIFKSEDEKTKYIETTFAAEQTEKVILAGRRLSCGLGNLISIGYDSKIYPCPSLSYPDCELGDLNSTIDEIMVKANEFANHYSVDNTNEECKSCELRYFCGGGCRACSYGLGDISGLDPSCDFYKQSLYHTLWNYDIPKGTE